MDDQRFEYSVSLRVSFDRTPGSVFVIVTVFKLGLSNSDMWLNLFLNLTGTNVLGGENVCVCTCDCFFSLLNLSGDGSLTSSCL